MFVSYSHRDAAAQERLRKHLAPWTREGVSVWYDENIEPGGELDASIARELRRAHVFVALFSPDYLASNYCWNIEYRRAMGRRARGTMRVVAVVVKPCSWTRTRAARFKLLPRDGTPPERWSSADAAYVNVAQGIGEVIEAVRRELRTPTSERARPMAGGSKPGASPGDVSGGVTRRKPRRVAPRRSAAPKSR